MPKREGDQWCSTTVRGARPKSGTTPCTWPAATGGAQCKCPTMPDPVECPHEWVQTYAGKKEEPASWWLEFQSLYQGCTGGHGKTRMQELTNRQAVSFRLPAA